MAVERQVVVETVQLTKIYRDFWMRQKVRALDRVDLQVVRGEVFGLLGPNGSGKSTLIKILLGLLFPTSGRAAVFGRDPRNIAIKDRIGYMPEDSYLYRYLNAEETLEFYGRLFNLPRHERRNRVNLLLDMVGLAQQRKRPLVEYSKGMARRIGLAQALINDPDFLFLDEPTTGLDPTGTREIKDLILELKSRGKTVFLCSHLLADVEDVCDRVAILYGGRVRRVGNINTLLEVQSKTQITTRNLKQQTISAVVNLIQEMEGPEAGVEVQAPRERLESFFLKVVEEARAAHLTTSGVTAGTGAAAFFGGIEREDKADDLMQSLLKAVPVTVPVEQTEGPEESFVLPAGKPTEPAVDQKLLSDLVRPSAQLAAPVPESEAKKEPQKDQPVVLPAGGAGPAKPATDEVLRGLLSPKSEADRKDARTDGRSDK